MIACGKEHWSSTLHSAWLCTDSHAKGIWDSLWAKSRQSLDETTILEIKPPSTCIRIFLNSQLFLCGSGFRPHVFGESGSRRIRNFLNPLYKSGIVWTLSLNHTSPYPNWGGGGERGEERPDGLGGGDVWHFRLVGATDPDIFWYSNVLPSSLPWIFNTVPSAILSLLYFWQYSFKSFLV